MTFFCKYAGMVCVLLELKKIPFSVDVEKRLVTVEDDNELTKILLETTIKCAELIIEEDIKNYNKYLELTN